MSTRINRVPAGLLDFLGTKSLGDNPSEFSGEVRPTLDLFPFFAAERLQTRSNSASQVGNVGYTFTVPAGEIWIPVYANIRQQVANAGDICDMDIQVRNFPGGTVTEVGTVLSTVIASENFTLAPSVATTIGQVLSLEHQFTQLQAWGTDTDIIFTIREAVFTTSNVITATLVYYRYTT